jgi:pimeloyl-ACP methyl ester carboxylesterase
MRESRQTAKPSSQLTPPNTAVDQREERQCHRPNNDLHGSDDRGFVLLHGAMLGRWIWDRVTPLLDRPALAVDLPGRGTTPAEITEVALGDAVDSVVADVDGGPFKQVVLVAHSLSGILVPAVTARIGDRVAHTVFVGAAVPRPGNSYLDVLPASQRLFLRVVLAIQRSGPRTPPWATRRSL